MRLIGHIARRLTFLFLWLASIFGGEGGTLFNLGSDWKFFRGTVEPSTTDRAAWRQRSFSDAAWEQGIAPFSYGEAGFSGTDLTGMQGSYTTLFLRRTFSVVNPAAVSALQLRAFFDDGLVVWVNGVRVCSTNAPASDSDLLSTSLATATVEPAEGTFDLPDPARYLVAGQNTMAVLVLNAALSSSDLVFDGELTSVEKLPALPVIIGISPEPGFVNELTSIAVVFSEPVSGVRPGDFLLNGIPATGVTGVGANYTFAFPQPAFGPVDITWGTLHTIVDFDSPPQRFDGGRLGSTWAYQLISRDGPAVTNVTPVPGTILRRFGAVEVNFSRPVEGIDAADLRVNGAGATNLVGVGAGPYRFEFPDAPAGSVAMEWAPNHGITTDDAVPVAFAGTGWQYRVDPARPAPDIIINEIMAENQTGIADEEKDPEDWIELYNRGSETVDLGGWSLSVDREEEGQWVFPAKVILPGQYLVVWASGKDRRSPAGTNRFHTNFKLNPTGDTLTLFGPELPRIPIDRLEYPEQAPNNSYGRQLENGQTVWRYLAEATPGAANSTHSTVGKVAEVHFSVERGFFNAPFSLSLACPTLGAEIRYTLNGSPPTLTNGFAYTEPIYISATRIVRAAAFAPNQLPSRVRSHTYLMNLGSTRRLLPVLSLVTDTNNLYGRTGIMESSPRNTTKHGAAWERPVSVELIRPEDNGGFQLDAGLRVAGGDYIRGLYNYRLANPPEGKYSFRLYFRGDYGPGRLNYPIFPGSTVQSFNSLHIRAGMNDPSNPFIKDEFVRALSLDVGIPACHGTFVYLFLNGVYKGLYNPAERVDDDFLQAYHGGGELWDVMGPNNAPIRGDATAWNQLRTAVRKDLTITSNYVAAADRMDMANFIDYLLPLIWADNDDWPHNNTRAAREKVAGGKFRFYPWDAEFSFTSHGVSYDTIATTLSTLSPPWGTTDYQAMFNSLKKSPEFRLLFADRVHRAFFNDGPLTDARIRARYNVVKGQAAPSIQGFDDLINTWISGRRRYVTNIFAKAGFLASSNAPVSSQLGGRVPFGYPLTLRNLTGKILFTTNGLDPRTPFTSTRRESASEYAAPILINAPLHLMARSLEGTNWSALVDLAFEVAQVGSPMRITEIMYNPPGGEAYEFLELQNTSALPTDVSGFSFGGLNFRFPTPFAPLPAGARIILASDARPADFQGRYPGLTVTGWFGGSLDNGGERITLFDLAGRIVTSVDYGDKHPWPVGADGGGASLEVVDPLGDPDDPANWQALTPGGTPGRANGAPARPLVQINELQAGLAADWIELFNPGTAPVQLDGWSLTDNSDARQFVFGAGTVLGPSDYLRVECDELAVPGGTRAPFALDRDGETISLYDARTNRVDVFTYGPVVDGKTVGLINGRLALCDATPLGPNEAAPQGTLADIRINEFLANPDGGDDWIELHNIGAEPVGVQGFAVVTSNAMARIASPVFVPGGGFTVLHADEKPGPNHLDLKLPAAGGLITLLSPTSEELDRVTYGSQASGIPMGRLPDGTGSFRPLPYSPTRGASNYLAELGTRLRISEIMARAVGGPDWVEIENISRETIPLAGYALGVKDPGSPRVRLPFSAQAQLNPGERRLIYFGPLPANFSPDPDAEIFLTLPEGLNDSGSELTLRDARDRVVDRVEYGLQLTGRTIGRVNQDWVLLATPSPGAANGVGAVLDSGAGLRLNEWLAAGGGTNDFVELYNPASTPVHLGGWILTDDPSIHGSTNNRILPLGFIDGRAFVRFRTDGQALEASDHMPFRLDQWGETIRLLNPAGQIIDTIDFVAQAEAVSEGRYPDGAPLIVRFPGSATPAAANALPSGDLDLDGMDDAWEVLHGLDPRNPADAGADFDQDGRTNLEEFRSGTDPQNAASVLRLEIASTVSGPKLRFIGQPGRNYRVEWVNSLGSGIWVPLTDVVPADVARDIRIDDPTPGELRPTRFYRIIVSP